MKIKEHLRKNSKHIDWKAVIFLTAGTQVVMPIIFCLIEGDFKPLIVCTVFACIFIYPAVLRLLFFGDNKKQQPSTCPTCNRPM